MRVVNTGVNHGDLHSQASLGLRWYPHLPDLICADQWTLSSKSVCI
jgi:hypothetical protein